MKGFLINFSYGFFLGLTVLLSLIGCLWGMSIAESNTRSVGFHDDSASPVFSIQPDSRTVTVLGFELHL